MSSQNCFHHFESTMSPKNALKWQNTHFCKKLELILDSVWTHVGLIFKIKKIKHKLSLKSVLSVVKLNYSVHVKNESKMSPF